MISIKGHEIRKIAEVLEHVEVGAIVIAELEKRPALIGEVSLVTKLAEAFWESGSSDERYFSILGRLVRALLSRMTGLRPATFHVKEPNSEVPNPKQTIISKS